MKLHKVNKDMSRLRLLNGEHPRRTGHLGTTDSLPCPLHEGLKSSLLTKYEPTVSQLNLWMFRRLQSPVSTSRPTDLRLPEGGQLLYVYCVAGFLESSRWK